MRSHFIKFIQLDSDNIIPSIIGEVEFKPEKVEVVFAVLFSLFLLLPSSQPFDNIHCPILSSLPS